jgi:dihydropyrimidine dehydrogenase (NAD+) subunit PreA
MSKKIDLSVKMGSIRFRNPILPGSSEIAFDPKSVKKCLDNGCGGIVTKSYNHVKTGTGVRPRPYLYYYRTFGKGLERSWLTDTLGDVWPLDLVVKDRLPEMKALCKKAGAPLIVSLIATNDPNDWAELAKEFSKPGPDMFELNFGCPHAEYRADAPIGRTVGEDINLSKSIIKAVKEVTDVPISIKVSPLVSPMGYTVKQYIEAGADFISAFNAPYGIMIDVEGEVPFGPPGVAGYLPGRGYMPMCLGLLNEIRKTVNVPISGIGGIFEPEDAIAYLLFGCSTVQICSAIFQKGYKFFNELVTGLEDWMKRKGYTEIEEFRGKVRSRLTTLKEVPMCEPYNFPEPQVKPGPFVPVFDMEKCTLCGKCVDVCLTDAIVMDERKKTMSIADDRCWNCGSCIGLCPVNAVSLIDRKTRELIWANKGTVVLKKW